MFKILYQYPRVHSRHANSSLATERCAFLSHLSLQGFARATLLRYARQLRVIVPMLKAEQWAHISHEEIAHCAQRWARRQRQRGRAQSLKWPAAHFAQVACAWCRFMGWLQEESRPARAHGRRLDTWAAFLRGHEGLAESTIFNYGWWVGSFLKWLKAQGAPLHQLTLPRVDGFMKHLSSKGLNRVSLATAAKALRRFLRYGYQQGWYRRDCAPAILSPRLYRQENLPAGPAWLEVRRLLGATKGETCRDLRNRAILLLLAVYGWRSGEVRTLRLEDIDWTRGVLRVHRSKTGRIQEYPLTLATRRAIRRYLKEARPDVVVPEVFLTLRAPFRPLSGHAVYGLTRSLMDRLDITSPKRGPHALRHACASYLLNSGGSLKQVGDHLGHQSLKATQIYAKVDLAGLRVVAAFDLGGLL